ncbi:hypothetical protein X275_08205 [Marinitoga sp. 1197]|uniref:tyrosine-type recombinase/integrase n=1 Tax=Marinitoga sp. 1197 TaxID=1428449 RepID=UPI0006410B49|nr:tyrosine-type recombinase/integrase [Marinitoga sp. 1197]KLO21864.1 hypothetical protein X275_08205 [Marinitoga sp. 1197]
MRINKYIESFLNELSLIKNVNSSTLKNYRQVLNEFSNIKNPASMQGLNLFMKKIKNQKPNTIARKITIVRSFLNYLYDHGKIKKKFWDNLKPPKYNALPRFLTEKEIKKLIKNSRVPYRYIFEFIYKTGIRLSELYNLEFEKLNNNTYIMRVIGKGNKERVLKVDKKIKDLFYQIEVLPCKRSIQREIKIAAKKAGIEKDVSVHKLRHSFAVSMINKGIPINAIQALLGHSNLNTTSIYLKFSSNDVKLI